MMMVMIILTEQSQFCENITNMIIPEPRLIMIVNMCFGNKEQLSMDLIIHDIVIDIVHELEDFTLVKNLLRFQHICWCTRHFAVM